MHISWNLSAFRRNFHEISSEFEQIKKKPEEERKKPAAGFFPWNFWKKPAAGFFSPFFFSKKPRLCAALVVRHPVIYRAHVDCRKPPKQEAIVRVIELEICSMN